MSRKIVNIWTSLWRLLQVQVHHHLTVLLWHQKQMLESWSFFEVRTEIIFSRNWGYQWFIFNPECVSVTLICLALTNWFHQPTDFEQASTTAFDETDVISFWLETIYQQNCVINGCDHNKTLFGVKCAIKSQVQCVSIYLYYLINYAP